MKEITFKAAKKAIKKHEKFLLSKKDGKKEFKKSKKFKKKHGFHFEDLWELDFCFARYVLPRLVKYRDGCCGTPYKLTKKEWRETLNKMIEAFYLIVVSNEFSSERED